MEHMRLLYWLYYAIWITPQPSPPLSNNWKMRTIMQFYVKGTLHGQLLGSYMTSDNCVLGFVLKASWAEKKIRFRVLGADLCIAIFGNYFVFPISSVWPRFFYLTDLRSLVWQQSHQQQFRSLQPPFYCSSPFTHLHIVFYLLYPTIESNWSMSSFSIISTTTPHYHHRRCLTPLGLMSDDAISNRCRPLRS